MAPGTRVTCGFTPPWVRWSRALSNSAVDRRVPILKVRGNYRNLEFVKKDVLALEPQAQRCRRRRPPRPIQATRCLDPSARATRRSCPGCVRVHKKHPYSSTRIAPCLCSCSGRRTIFCTRNTACCAYVQAGVPYFVPGIPHVVLMFRRAYHILYQECHMFSCFLCRRELGSATAEAAASAARGARPAKSRES